MPAQKRFQPEGSWNLDTEVKQVLEGLLKQLVGRSTWGVAIGPAGVHVHFGEVHAALPPRGVPNGDFSIWVKGAIKIINYEKEIIYQSGFPPQADQPRLSGLVSGKTVSEAFVGNRRHVLGLVLNDEMLLKAYPFSEEGENYPWILYNHLREKPFYAVVNQDKCEILN